MAREFAPTLIPTVICVEPEEFLRMPISATVFRPQMADGTTNDAGMWNAACGGWIRCRTRRTSGEPMRITSLMMIFLQRIQTEWSVASFGWRKQPTYTSNSDIRAGARY